VDSSSPVDFISTSRSIFVSPGKIHPLPSPNPIQTSLQSLPLSLYLFRRTHGRFVALCGSAHRCAAVFFFHLLQRFVRDLRRRPFLLGVLQGAAAATHRRWPKSTEAHVLFRSSLHYRGLPSHAMAQRAAGREKDWDGVAALCGADSWPPATAM
jgi:hypothetical protein